MPELDEVPGRSLAAPEVGRPDADDVARGDVHRVDHDERQPQSGQRLDLVVPELVGHRDHGAASVDGEVAGPGGGLDVAEGRWSTDFTPTVTATPSSAAATATPWTISEE